MLIDSTSTSEIEAIEPEDNPVGVGATLDEQYELVEQLPPVSGRPCFLAKNVDNDDLVELVVTNAALGRVRYLVRSCSHRPSERMPAPPPPPSAAGERALSTFQQRVALTGVSIRCKDRVVFHGWDRERQRPVRVVVEPVD